MAPDRTNTEADKLKREHQRTKLAAQVSKRKNAVLELDETGQTLCVWYWCVS